MPTVTRVKERPRIRSRTGVLWLAGLALAGGSIVLAAALILDMGRELPAEDLAVTPTPVELPRDALDVVGRFIETAVARGDLGEAWKLAGPHLRRGMTLAEWKQGDIPVRSFPAASIEYRLKVDYVHESEAVVEVALVPKQGFDMEPELFFATLVKIGPQGARHWVVDGWVARQ